MVRLPSWCTPFFDSRPTMVNADEFELRLEVIVTHASNVLCMLRYRKTQPARLAYTTSVECIHGRLQGCSAFIVVHVRMCLGTFDFRICRVLSAFILDASARHASVFHALPMCSPYRSMIMVSASRSVVLSQPTSASRLRCSIGSARPIAIHSPYESSVRHVSPRSTWLGANRAGAT